MSPLLKEARGSRRFINIDNVAATAALHQNIDLNSIVRIFPGVEYRPEQFPGLVYHLRKPKTTSLLFGSGKMVCTGAKLERQACKAVMKVVEELKRNGVVILSKPETQDFVGRATFIVLGGMRQPLTPRLNRTLRGLVIHSSSPSQGA